MPADPSPRSPAASRPSPARGEGEHVPSPLAGEGGARAGGVIVITGFGGAVICLFVAFILGVGGISGTRAPVFASVLAVGSILIPVVGLVVLKGQPSTGRRIIAVTLGVTPLVLISLMLFRIFWMNNHA